MSGEILIRAEGVAKKFARTLKSSMFYGVADIARDFFGLPDHAGSLRRDEFWALQEMAFEVKRGECLGLIGPNGAGKSTLLKLLNGLFMPDRGRIEVRGRVGALIELGAGFHPLLTGRENIYINGAILGLKKKEIDRKFDSIIEFAELGEFIDAPVKFYSSGMFVRLGFAVAAHLEPDILLVDEILAVGDVGFRAKCYNFIAELMKNSAVIMVSHNLPMIARYATKVMVLNHGQAAIFEEKAKSFKYYYDLYDDELPRAKQDCGNNRLLSINIIDEQGDPTDTVANGEKMRLRIRAELEEESPVIHLIFLTQENTVVANIRSQPGDLRCENHLLDYYIELDTLVLSPGKFKLNIIIFDRERLKYLIWHEAALSFMVEGPLSDYAPTSVIMKARYRPTKNAETGDS